MLLSRSDFETLGGFDPALNASEDYDLCRRALKHGGRIVEDNGLPAFHQGAPRNIGEFARRELWHGGAGDLGDLLKQRVTILSAVWLVMHLGLAIALLAGLYGAANVAVALGVLCSAGIVALLAASLLRHGGLSRIREIPKLTALFYVYYWSRVAGLLRCLVSQGSDAVTRTGRE